MKRLGVMLFTVVLSASFAVVAQDASTQQPSESTTTSTTKKAAKLQHLKGKISDDGKSFTADKDNKTYTIENSDAVKGHEGHNVRLSGHVDASNNSIHVTSVKMSSGKKPMSEQPPK
jgi:heat shock protein HslJ